MQVITGSHDKTVKLWDLRKGKTMTTLTYHKKSVRGLALHPTEYCFASASAENIKKFRLPRVSSHTHKLCSACRNGHSECVSEVLRGVLLDMLLMTGTDVGSQ